MSSSLRSLVKTRERRDALEAFLSENEITLAI